MSNRHLSLILAALLMGAVAFAGYLLIVGPERVEEPTVEVYEAHQELVAEQGAVRILETLRELNARVAMWATNDELGLEDAKTPEELERVLEQLSHPDDRALDLTLVVRDPLGRVVAAGPSDSEFGRHQLDRIVDSAPAGPNEAFSICRQCNEASGTISVVMELDRGHMIVAKVVIDRLAEHVFRELDAPRESYLSLVDDSGEVLYAHGGELRRQPDESWFVGRAPIPDTNWSVEVAAPPSVIASEVRARASSLLYGAYGIVVALLLGILTLVLLMRRQQRERVEQVRALAIQDKLATLGLLAAGTAHEIRNAIAAAQMKLAVAAAKSSGEQKADIQRACKSVDRLGELAENLSGYAGRDGPEHQTFELGTAVEEALRVVEPKLQRSVQLQVRLEMGLMVSGVCGELVQVIVNLLLNALEAARESGEPRIELATYVEDKWAVLSVADNGSGIDPVVQAQIFEPFFTTKDGAGEGGTGIGLWLCSQIIEQHDGEIQARNREGGGAKFVVRLPLQGLERPVRSAMDHRHPQLGVGGGA